MEHGINECPYAIHRFGIREYCPFTEMEHVFTFKARRKVETKENTLSGKGDSKSSEARCAKIAPETWPDGDFIHRALR